MGTGALNSPYTSLNLAESRAYELRRKSGSSLHLIDCFSRFDGGTASVKSAGHR